MQISFRFDDFFYTKKNSKLYDRRHLTVIFKLFMDFLNIVFYE